MFASAARAFRLIFEPAFLGIVVKALLLTLLLAGAELALSEWAVVQLPVLGSPLVNKLLVVLAPILTIFLISLLGAPVAALFGSLFLDSLAGKIETRDYPADPPALPGSFWINFKAGMRLTLMILGADLALLPVDIGLPGVGEIANIVVNGWLLGWEYFELAALRHLPAGEADVLRHSHRGQIWLAGIAISFLSVVPGVNLIAPLFGTAQMVHLFKRFNRGTRPA